MLGSPGRRRRLIEAFAPNHNAENYYTSVPQSNKSASPFRRRRTQKNRGDGDARKRPHPSGDATAMSKTTISTGFRPIDPMADHGYRINVAKDGSMITAVPIEKQPLRSSGGSDDFKSSQRSSTRASPILFSQPNSSPNVSVNGSTSWSRQGLLDARGKQRHKMKRMRPVVIKTNATAATKKQFPKIASDLDSSFPNDPFNNVVHTARDKLKQAKGFLAFAGTNSNGNDNSAQQHHQPQQKSGTASTQPKPPRHSPRSRTRVRWDLSPERQRQQPKPQPQSQSQQVEIARINPGNCDDTDASFSSFPILSPSHKFDDTTVEEKKASYNASMISKQKGNTQQPLDTLLQQRMTEIQSQQEVIADKISKKDAIKGTLITAIDGNLERNRRQIKALEEELKEIKLHLKLESKSKQHHLITNFVPKQSEEDCEGVRLARSPSGAYDMESVEVGDPSITAETESVAELFRKDKTVRTGMAATGLDPPARPYPATIAEEPHPLYRRGKKEPDGPRISAVIGGNNVMRTGSNAKPASNHRSVPSTEQRPPLHRTQHLPAPRQPHSLRQEGESLAPQPQKQREKLVHFNLPNESDSVELRFESINSSDIPSADFAGVRNEGGGDADASRKIELFDVDALFNEEAYSIINSEHHDIYQRTDNTYHVAVSEDYSRENYHRDHHHGEEDELGSLPASINHNNYNGNRGVSSNSVETDPDLSFIHTVAAVVIQTAVRRFLAEIAVEERLYAVNVIQTAICNWMAHKRILYFNSGDIPDDQCSDGVFNDEQEHPASFDRVPPQRTKRVMFEDDYNDFRDFSATEIQRCYRGWWARDGLEVDHFTATTIQRIVRGWLATERLDVDHYCAVEIQRIVRGHLSRMSFIYDLYCIIVVQSVVRRYVAFYTSAVRLANILYLQAIYRGYRVRAELMRYVRNGQEIAATFIQSQWRSYDTRMNYMNSLADILIVQSVARRWLILKKTRRRMGKRQCGDRNDVEHEREEITGYGQIRANCHRSHVPNAQKMNSNVSWQQHRLNVVSGPANPRAILAQHPPREGLDDFHGDSIGGEEWYDGNKSEASDLLKSWKGRKSK